MPQDPIRAVVENMFTLQRLSNGLSADAKRRVRSLVDEIVSTVARLDPTGLSLAQQRAKVAELMAEVSALTGQTYNDLHNTLIESLSGIGEQQGQWAANQLQRSIGTVAVDIREGAIGADRMRTILESRPFQGETLRQWADSAGEATVKRVRRQVQLGLAQSETLDDIVRRVRGRKVGGEFVGGVLQASTRDTEAIVRTATNFIAAEGHEATYRANSDVTTTYEYTATLDSRTTLICASLDGQTYGYDDDAAPRPPQHFQCRSVITPVIDWESLGVDPPPGSTRASADGPVKASTTYEQWLKGQPAGVQDEVLGKGRAALFRDGKVTLRDMVTSDRGVVTLDQLKSKAA